MNKHNQYQALVQKRKQHKFQQGLKNPSKTCYDSNEIEPWAQWQHNLDVEVLVLGQEFSNFETFVRCKGKVEVENDKYESPSNKNLAEFLSEIGLDPGHPNNPREDASLFITNCVMGLKEGAMLNMAPWKRMVN